MKKPTKSQRQRWTKVAELGCLICGGLATIHHLFTGAGGRKNHNRVAPLCWEHHVGLEGIDGRVMSKKQWQAKYMTEPEMELKTKQLLGEDDGIHRS